MNTDVFLDSKISTEQTKEGTEDLVCLPKNEIDPRLKLLSHSSRTTLHKCPRKYQLYRLKAKEATIESEEQQVTFAYGHAVGEGIQASLEGLSETRIIMRTFLAWDTDALYRNDRQRKSLYEAIFAVQKFMYLRDSGYLKEYELVYYNNKPAIEMAFKITLPNGFAYRGLLDAVLRHKHTKEVLVLELKTTSMQPDTIHYKNSGQTLGYSIILDIIFPHLSSYSVLYLVYHTKTKEYTEFPFEKTLLQRALWLQELIVDCSIIELYEQYSIYPLHGESCNDFFKPCKYYGLCTLSTENLTAPLTKGDLIELEKKEQEYSFIIDFEDLINNQIAKTQETL